MSHANHTTRDASKKPTLRLRVSPTAESILRSGHPWLFAGSVREQNREGDCGELAIVFDRNDCFLAVGLYDPDSPLRLRVLHAGKPTAIDAAWWRARLESTLARRRPLFDATTTGFRWMNGESDGWPGLVLDRYDTALVLKIYTAAWLPRLTEILGLILEALAPERVVLRLSRNIQEQALSKFQRRDGEVLHGTAPDGAVIFLENSVRFEAEVLRGQKTGFFLDQRENRRRVGELARGREVLNAFSFSGGFSLYAARGGATATTDLDISTHALESAKRNFALNQADANTARCRHETVQADTFEWLRGTRRQFGLIVLDPPSLAKRETERDGAIAAYGRLATDGIARLLPGGVLLAASCSAHVTADEFFAAVRQVAQRSKRPFTELTTTGHAPDHAATFLEAQYLKAIYLRF